MTRDRSLLLLLLCFFLSGFAALIYETAWTREFAFVFGTSHLAVATVLAAYMAGLAAGAGVASRFAGRVRRPVLVYGLLELGIALAALAVPFAVQASTGLYVAFFGDRPPATEAAALPTALFYLICSFVILVIPTMMMGATLPLLARHAVRSEEEIGGRVGGLYACNTAGAVAGTLVAAFWLLPALGLRQTIYVAAGVNALVFLAAWALSRSGEEIGVSKHPAASSASRDVGRRVLPLVLASGFASFVYEVLWVRLLGHVIGGSVYAFATMLASFLAGIALGASLASRFARTRGNSALGFALVQCGIASLSLLAFLGVGFLPDLAARLEAAGTNRLLTDVSLGALTLFPAALCIGATFPLAVRMRARGLEDVGPASGEVYAWNTAGAIAGSVAAGFWLIPTLGFEGTLTLCVATNLVLAAVTAVAFTPARHPIAAAALLGLCVLAFARPSAPWRILRSSVFSPQPAAGEVSFFAVGRAATVLLLHEEGEWLLRTNGLPEATIQPPGFFPGRGRLARWLTAVPVVARPEARSMLVVGLGGGIALESVPASVERIEVVELEPEVVNANRAIGSERARDPLSDPRVRLQENDARNALLLMDQRFDVIVSQPSHPWTSGASHLYTREFFGLIERRLADGGVFVQWIGLSFVDEPLFRTLLATLGDVFANIRVYVPPPGGGALFLASNGPLDVEESAVRALEASPAALLVSGIETPEDLLAALVLDEAGSRELGRDALVNRDDWNLLQSRSPYVFRDRLARLRLQSPLFEARDPLVGSELPDVDRFHLLRRLPLHRARRFAEGFEDGADRWAALAVVALSEGDPAEARRSALTALAANPAHPEARAVLLRAGRRSLIETAPESIVGGSLTASERAVVAGWRALHAADFEALRVLDAELRLPVHDPLRKEALRLQIAWRSRSGDRPLAEEAVELADRLLIGGSGSSADFLARARASAAAGDASAALSSLIQVGRSLPGAGAASRLRRLAREVLSRVPPEPPLESMRNLARQLLAPDPR